ncbi:serine/threonine-protein kinase [bacterium]|nr:serine/threonine-protein kinase [bacterium]MCI0603618.1 serine/threonine-protein kinase [bacterium]
MPGKIILRVTQGPIQGSIFTFVEHDTFIFGRSEDCHGRLSPDDSTASRHHFLLEANPPEARLRDLGSLNGTYVNGIKYGGRGKNDTPHQGGMRRFPEVDLKDADQIRVGDTVMRISVEFALCCCECGKEISEADQAQCEWVGGTHICPACKQKLATVNEPSRKQEIRRCDQCGKDVSAEIGKRRYGNYVCLNCRNKAEADPLALFLRMLAGKPEEETPHNIPGYEIVKMLGKGGMGAVYLAVRQSDGRNVALKLMLSRVAVDEKSRQQFLREIEITRQLRHTNIVELYDHGSAGTAFYFAMEYCPGGSLDSLIEKRGGKVSLLEAKPIMLSALEGLAFAHRGDFVHRDLKPQNILLDANGVAKISDFGLAKNFDKAGLSGLTATGTFGGTPGFLPREQLINYRFAKPISDVWSLGATFYCMLTGQLPRDFPPGRDPIEVILRGGIVPIRKRDPGIPKKLAEVIDHALQEQLNDRYATADVFLMELTLAI